MCTQLNLLYYCLRLVVGCYLLFADAFLGREHAYRSLLYVGTARTIRKQD